jgi:hypothetical protein
MKKKFNITGTCRPLKHYMADVSSKLADTLQMVEDGEYFIINRPRQYGKTTMLYAVADVLKAEGDYVVFNMSFEGVGEVFFQNEENFSKGFIGLLKEQSETFYPQLLSAINDAKVAVFNLDTLSRAITTLVRTSSKPIVVLIDEVDKSSNNEIFIHFLGMLRNKYLQQELLPTFQSVILAGLHDIKTLKAKIRPDAEQKYNSPWNIAADYKVDMNLQVHEIVPMLEEYKADKGVKIDSQAIAEQLFYYTAGYPFLVSKLCKILDEDLKKHDIWTNEDIETAVRLLTKESNANFDSLTKNLENNPELYILVYQVAVENTVIPFNIHDPIIKFGVLYGIFTPNGSLKIHNKIYQEVLLEYMTVKLIREKITQTTEIPQIYKNADGSLDMEAVLLGFQAFMKKEYSRKDRDFLEKHGRLVFLAFIKPIINGEGYDFKEPQISDEKRLDVVITHRKSKYIAELKLWYGPVAHERGLKQLSDYLDAQSLTEGYLVIFDHSEVKNWNSEMVEAHGKKIFVVWV